ncbi:MAG: diguanylate cyclase [Treponema sp.]|jgi:diguanylate cyclase (GGDEF)-like protein|nr:diguanylate cyclase [Treponema sp.]
MKKWFIRAELLIIIFGIPMFIAVSVMSITSIKQQEGNARVVNYAGIVRGSTQRLVKEELYNNPDDKRLQELDGIVNELISGEGPNDLIVLPYPDFQATMVQVKEKWELLKKEIMLVRAGGDTRELYNQSQLYFDLTHKAVFQAESYSEAQIARSLTILIGCNVFSALILAGIFFYNISLRRVRRKAEMLSHIAYEDSLTGLPTRARCDQVCEDLERTKPAENIAIFMFDMNNLKAINNKLGRQAGDQIIKAFAEALKKWASGNFVGRYGRDEFLAIFSGIDHGQADELLSRLDKLVENYNGEQQSDLERISFASGYHIDNLNITSINRMIYTADRKMYEWKQQMKRGQFD